MGSHGIVACSIAPRRGREAKKIGPCQPLLHFRLGFPCLQTLICSFDTLHGIPDSCKFKSLFDTCSTGQNKVVVHQFVRVRRPYYFRLRLAEKRHIGPKKTHCFRAILNYESLILYFCSRF